MIVDWLTSEKLLIMASGRMRCARCGSTNIVRKGKTAPGQQRYRCSAWGNGVLNSGHKWQRQISISVQGTQEERNSFALPARLRVSQRCKGG